MKKSRKWNYLTSQPLSLQSKGGNVETRYIVSLHGMKPSRLWVNVCFAALSTLAFVTITTPGFTGQNSLNFIFAVSGDVQIKRPEWTKYQPAYVGAFVNPADRLQLTQGASAKVLCSNLSVWYPRTQGEFPVSGGCKNTPEPILRSGSKVGFTRAGNDPTIPYLISPRDSSILTRQPTLRWNPVAGATSYQVRILGPGVSWTTDVKQSQVVYSGEQPLKAGSRYWVTVTANNGASNGNEEGRYRGFTVLNDVEKARLNTEIGKLQQQALKDDPQTLALAHLYRSNDLNADAIDLLAGLVQKGSQNSAVYQLLGSTYQQVGLNLLAKERYLTALKLAKAEKNLEAQAIIQGSLGEVDVSLDKLKDAGQWYQAAQSSYRTLGDTAQVRELQQKIDGLKGRV
jgi:hypothetical protein